MNLKKLVYSVLFSEIRYLAELTFRNIATQAMPINPGHQIHHHLKHCLTFYEDILLPQIYWQNLYLFQ